MKNKYPDYIMKKLRQRFDLDENDISRDDKINSYSFNTAFSEVLNWEGLIGYDYSIKKWIQDIYRVNLDEVERKEYNDETNYDSI